MASCMQHLFMVAPAKRGILAGAALVETTQHHKILVELQVRTAIVRRVVCVFLHFKNFCSYNFC